MAPFRIIALLGAPSAEAIRGDQRNRRVKIPSNVDFGNDARAISIHSPSIRNARGEPGVGERAVRGDWGLWTSIVPKVRKRAAGVRR